MAAITSLARGLRLIPAFSLIVADALIRSLLSIHRRPSKLPWIQFFSLALVRSFRRHDPDLWIRSTPPTTSEVYEEFAEKNHIPKTTELTKAGVKVMWLSKPDSPQSKVLVYFHGGAYVRSAAPGHLKVLHAQAERCNPALAVAVVEYTLAPTKQYPSQLREAVCVIHHLRSEHRIKPSDMIIAGDSAGGNLTAALVLHSAHPHPEVSPLDLGGDIFGGVFLISPWVTFSTASPSMKTNLYSDYLDLPALSHAARLFNNGVEDMYSEPLNASPESWKGIKTDHVGIVAGDTECMVDDIVQFSRNLQEYNQNTQLYIATNEAHVQMAVSRSMNLRKSESEGYFEKWLDERLRR